MYLNNDARNILFRTIRHHLDMSFEDVANEYNKLLDVGQVRMTAHVLLRYQQGADLLDTLQQMRLANMLIAKLESKYQESDDE